MIDFTPLIRAFLEAAVWGTAIYLLMAGRRIDSAWPWAMACVFGAGLLGTLLWQPSYTLERWSLPSVAGPMGGALCSVVIAVADRTKTLPRWLGIGLSIAGFYFASMLLRLVLLLVVRTE